DAEINLLQLPSGEDPGEVILHNPAVWTYAVAHPLPLVDYYFSVKTAGLNLREPTGKTEAAKRLLPIIAMISDRIKRDAYLRKLATMISIDERLLYDELQQVVRGQKANSVVATFSASSGQQQGAKPAVGTSSASIMEEEKAVHRQQQGQASGLDKRKANKLQWEDYLIGLLLQNPALCHDVCGIIHDGDFAGTDTRELYHILNSLYARGSSPLHQPIEEFVPPALLVAVARARQSAEFGSPL